MTHLLEENHLLSGEAGDQGPGTTDLQGDRIRQGAMDTTPRGPSQQPWPLPPRKSSLHLGHRQPGGGEAEAGSGTWMVCPGGLQFGLTIVESLVLSIRVLRCTVYSLHFGGKEDAEPLAQSQEQAWGLWTLG